MSDEFAAVKARIQNLEDREEIRELILAYRKTIDARDFQTYASLFARDGIWDNGQLHVQGREEILGMLLTLQEQGSLADHGGADFHLVGNTTISVDGERGTASSTWLYLIPAADNTPKLALLGQYDDVFKREDGRWRFASRHSTVPFRPDAS